MTRHERGFSMVEVLVALMISIIGLAGVLLMQSNAMKSNRRSAAFTRACMIAEEALEGARAQSATTLLAGLSYQPQTYAGVTYSIAVNAAEVSAGSNLVRVSVAVSYSEDGDSTTVDDRVARLQMIRTKTETL